MRLRLRCITAVLFIFGAAVVLELLFFHSKGNEFHRSRSDQPGDSHSHGISLSELQEKLINNHVASGKERLESVNKVCNGREKSWETLSVAEQQILSKHIIVNDEHKLLFCYVPKAACANWKRVITVLDGGASDSNDIKKINHMAFTFLQDLPPLAAQRKLKEYYKFMFVREPLSRLQSAYKDKFVLNHTTTFHKRYGKAIVKRFRKNAAANPKGDDVSLEEFFQFLGESNVEEMNEHWMPFYELCQPCTVSYNYIGSVENLEADASQVLRELNVDQQVSFPRQQNYYKQGGKGYSNKKPASVAPRVLRKVLKKYALDFELFSYPMPGV